MNNNKTKQKEALEKLLAESVASAKQREQSLFDQQAQPFGKSLILFGAGGLGRKTLEGLRKIGIEPLAFSDNSPALWGKKVNGLEVLSPREAAERFRGSAVFILTIWTGKGIDTMAERCQPLLDLGCKVMGFGSLFWKYPQFFLPHYSFDLPHKTLEAADAIRSAFELWVDDASREEFVAQIRWRLHLDFDGLPRPVDHKIYFPEDLVKVSKQEIFVDCGAFDGDTMAIFLNSRGNNFSRYIALEADPKNFSKLRENRSQLVQELQNKIIIHSLAVGARREKVCIDATGTEASVVGQGTLEIDCVPLDELLADGLVTWIKMDIEGSEPAALRGASWLIRENAPVLAICVYHQQNHVWTIPLLIRELSNYYHFFLRPHVLESWDLVCYAIPKNRLE